MPRSALPSCAAPRSLRSRLARVLVASLVGLAAAPGLVAADDAPSQATPAATAEKPAPANGGRQSSEPAAASETAGEAPASLNPDEVRKRLEAVASDDSLTDEVRAGLREPYEKAVASLKQAAADRAAIAKLKQAAASAEAREEAATQALEEAADLDLPVIDPTAAIAEVETARREVTAKLAALTTELQEIRATISDRRKESKTLPQEIATLEQTLAERRKPVVDDPELDAAAAEAQATARRAGIEAATAALELAGQKLRTFEAEATLLPLEEQLLQRRIAAATERVEAITKLGVARRQDVIESRRAEFDRDLAAVSEERRREAAVTTSLLDRWEPLTVAGKQFAGELVETRDRAAGLQADLRETESLVAADLETGGTLSRSVGFLLVRKRSTLPADARLAERARAQSRMVEDTQDLLARIDARIDDLGTAPSADKGKGRDIDGVEREILQTMDRDAERFLVDTLIPLGVQQQSLRSVVRDYRRLIGAHLLWVRSDRPLAASDFRDTAAGFAALARPIEARRFAGDLAAAVTARPLAVIAGLVSLLVLAVLHHRFVRQIVRLGGVAAGRNGLRFGPSLTALAMTVLAAIPIWLGLWLSSRLLAGMTAADSFGGSVAGGLATVAALALPLEFLRQFLRPHGLAAAHFEWPAAVTGPLRQAARRAVSFALPLVFLWRLLDLESSTADEINAAARLAFMLLMGVAVAILWALARPATGFTAALAGGWGGPAAVRLGWLWRGCAVAVPLGLAGLMGMGYGYSAVQLAVSGLQSIWLVIVALVIHGLALRWLLISRRRIALDQLRQRAAERVQAEAGAAASTPPVLDDTRLDVTTINQQTRRLFNAALFVGVLAGLYLIWSPVLPALGFLERVTLWQQRAADGTVTGAVTLANLLLAVPILALTFIVVGSAPGLLEAAVLRHLPLDNPSRYAITTLASYLLAGIGLALAAGTLGLSWGAVQWLVAGLSVGLGFGLQEIVANFICGIILLFEQPIRVGDVVTIDGVNGVVSRIRIRATTVTTWERQEYIVPNKDLITGRVTNWTLSDTTNRAEIRVGVAYGTDTRVACGLLREICNAHPEVLADPAPLITFEAFGDSSLTLVLRLYLASLDNRLGVITDVHTAIHEQFAAAGIEIAFPQLDIHLRRPS
jgi:potassium-dependent mechanosensitive channel